MLPYSVEIDGDVGPEWLVQIIVGTSMPVFWLAYDQLEDGTYQVLESDFPVLYPISNAITLLTTHDLTGDRLSDAILVDESYTFGTYFTSFYMLRGSKDGFTSVQNYHFTTYAYDDALPYELAEGNGLPGLQLTFYESLNWNCSWDRLVTYRWPDGHEQKQESGTYPPDSPECSLAKAVSLKAPLGDDTALNLLLSAVGHFDIQAEDPKELAAFARYRLAWLYSKRGSDTQARQQLQAMLDLLQDNPDQEEYWVNSLKPLLSEPKINALGLCQMGYNAPYEIFPLWWKFANTTHLFHSYPGGNPYPEAICPLVGQIEQQMQNIHFNGAGSPQAAIEGVGLPLFALEKYPFGESSLWFAMLDTRPYVLIAYVKRSQGSIWQRMDVLDTTSKPLILNQDITGDGINEFSVAVSTDWLGACQSGYNYSVHITSGVGDGYVASYSGEVCMPGLTKVNLIDTLADKDGDHLSDLLMDWVGSQSDEPFDRTVERQGPLTWFTEAERTQLFSHPTPQPTLTTGSDPQADLLAALGQTKPDYAHLRTQIVALLAQTEPGDLNYDQIHSRLRYLVALSYQLEGQEDEAVKRYLELARSQPYTFWSGLASDHLVKK